MIWENVKQYPVFSFFKMSYQTYKRKRMKGEFLNISFKFKQKISRAGGGGRHLQLGDQKSSITAFVCLRYIGARCCSCPAWLLRRLLNTNVQRY